METPEKLLEAITVEAMSLNGNVVGVQVSLYGVPVHYVPKTTQIDLDEEPQIGPCEMWLHWAHEAGRIVTRPLDESKAILQS